MKAIGPLLLAALLGAALWFFFLKDEVAPGPSGPSAPTLEDELEANPHLRATTGTLEILVRARDGSVPAQAEVGYIHEGKRRMRYAGEKGRRVFADAALGDLIIVARAPGYQEVEQRRTLIAGVMETVFLELVPER